MRPAPNLGSERAFFVPFGAEQEPRDAFPKAPLRGV